MLDETTICNAIRARYADDDRLPHPAEVAVSARGGTVLLRGTVRSVHQRRVATALARSVDGVSDVHDQLQVDPRDRWQDGEIRGTALQALMSTAGMPADQLDVAVASGWLTLKGQVKHQRDSDAAFDAVAGLPGVGGITNEITVVTAGGR